MTKKSYLGIVLIVLGILGILMIANMKFMGFAVNDTTDIVSVSDNTSNFVNNSYIRMSKISNVFAYPGDKKNILLNVQNIGNIFLNNCKLNGKGDIKEWVYNNESLGLASGQKLNFDFTLNVPEKMPVKKYVGEIELKCDEASISQFFDINVLKGLDSVKILDVKNVNNYLNVSYSFDSRDYIGDGVSMDVWMVDANGVEIVRARDAFPLNKDRIERSVLLKVPDSAVGIYNINLAFSSDPGNYIQQSVVIGKHAEVSGFAVLDEPGNKLIGYGIFLLIILAGLFFIIKNYWSSDNPSDDLSEEKASKKKNKERYVELGE